MKLTEKQKIRRRWVAALRSGKYKQITGALRQKYNKGGRKSSFEGYCCLGVLCELAVKAKVIGPPVQNSGGIFIYSGNDSELPQKVREWAGLTTVDGKFTDEKLREKTKQNDLAGLNDYSGKRFRGIASIIESEPEGLFEEEE